MDAQRRRGKILFDKCMPHAGDKGWRSDELDIVAALPHGVRAREAPGPRQFVDATGEPESDAAAEPLDELIGRSLGDDLAGTHNGDAITERLGFVGEVGDEDDGGTAVSYPLDEPPHTPPGAGVEALRQFIEKDDFRVVQERERQEETLSLAARQSPEWSSPNGHEVPFIHDLGRSLLALGEEPDSLFNPKAFGQIAVLELTADPSGKRGPIGDWVEPEHSDSPGIGPAKALCALNRRRLPGAIRAENAEDFAPFDMKTDVIDDGGTAVALRQPVEVHDW